MHLEDNRCEREGGDSRVRNESESMNEVMMQMIWRFPKEEEEEGRRRERNYPSASWQDTFHALTHVMSSFVVPQ